MVVKPSQGRSSDGQPTNRRIKHHKTAATSKPSPPLLTHNLPNQPRQMSSTETSNAVVPHRTIYNQSFDLRKFGGMSIILEMSKTAHDGAADNNLNTPLLHRLRSKQICGRGLSIR